MHAIRHWLVLLLMLLILALLPLRMAVKAAPTVTDYDLSWWTVDNGGVVFYQADGYELSGAIGQPDAHRLSAGGYVLEGGFWPGAPVAMRMYLPLIHR